MKINPKRLEVAMARACMSTCDLGKASGLSFETVSKLRRGVQNPTTRTVGKIARALDVSVEYLLGLEE